MLGMVLSTALSIAFPVSVLAVDSAPVAASVSHVNEQADHPADQPANKQAKDHPLKTDGGAAANPELFDPLSSGYLLKLVSSLVIVLALMFVVVWLLKRTGRFNGRAGSYPLNVLAQMPVGTRERVLLVAVGDRQLLLGVSQGHIEPLGWVDPPIAPDTIAHVNPLEGSFAQLMKKHSQQTQTQEGSSGADPKKRESGQ